MATMTIKVNDELAREFREFALRETGSMRGLSTIAEKALQEYLDNHRKGVETQTTAKIDINPLRGTEAIVCA